MIKVGITGGIGSGKTIVCRIFQSLGVPVYHADVYSKILTDTDPEIIQKLKINFGEDIYNENGINRKKLASIIFYDATALKTVNNIIHPKVREHFLAWCEKHSEHRYILQEAAILFESGAYRFFDRYITVTASVETRIARVLSREDTTIERINKIMSNQMTEEEKISRSHYIINNDGKTLVIPQVLEIHKNLNLLSL